MSMTTLLGLSFGVFPCLLFGFIMLLSLLICEYIEEYVAKHLCAWKNRRRRSGLRSFYHDFRARRNTHSVGAQHYSSRSRSYNSTAWANGSGTGNNSPPEALNGSPPFPASAPPERPPLAQYSAITPAYPPNDPPPSYEECILPRTRSLNNSPTSTTTSSPNKPESMSEQKEK